MRLFKEIITELRADWEFSKRNPEMFLVWGCVVFTLSCFVKGIFFK